MFPIWSGSLSSMWLISITFMYWTSLFFGSCNEECMEFVWKEPGVSSSKVCSNPGQSNFNKGLSPLDVHFCRTEVKTKHPHGIVTDSCVVNSSKLDASAFQTVSIPVAVPSSPGSGMSQVYESPCLQGRLCLSAPPPFKSRSAGRTDGALAPTLLSLQAPDRMVRWRGLALRSYYRFNAWDFLL